MSEARRQLTLFDSTCLIVGIIIGAGIYQMAPDIAKGAGNSWAFLGIWVLGGLLSLCGALSYAELATAYPRHGGDYVYLGKAYGNWAGFLFAWAQMTVVRPGDIAVMAFAFGTYARQIYDFSPAIFSTEQIYAAFAAIVLTFINLLGVREGKWTQNLLTLAKAAGLLLIVAVAAFAVPKPATPATDSGLPFSLALIFVLFTYGGWNEMAYVAAEVKDPRRNIGRALVVGLLAVTLLYILINLAFLHVLGFHGLAASEAVATETVSTVFPGSGAILISILVCVSALGAVNGLIFTGARISSALGTDYRLFGALGKWHARFKTPFNALVLQGVIAVALILFLGSFLNAVIYTAATVYSFYFGSTISLIILRRKEPQVERPFRVPLYPFVPLLFAAVCLLLIYSAVTYKPVISLGAIALLLAGFIIYFFAARGGKPDGAGDP